MRKFKTLVIDDSPHMREFVAESILAPRGFEVEIATDGLEGLQKVVTQMPDVILTDFEMPRMNGLEFLRELRKHDRQVPVILMTSHGSEQVAVEVFRLGVHDYLTKPFEPQQMLDAIETALTMARLQQEKEVLTKQVMEANRQLRQHVHDLNTLYRVGKSITSLVQPDKLLDRIVDAVLVVTRCEECQLLLVDSHTGAVKARLHKTQSQLANNSGTSLQLDHPHDMTEQMMSVPLKVGQAMLGHLSIRKRVRRGFTERDNRLLHILADYSAIAIHNKQLWNRLQQAKEEEKQQIRGLFERYVSPAVVEQIMARPNDVSLGGSRTTISVLFADVRGFTRFGSQISPEILVQLLNQYMQVAAEAILSQEGTLDKFMGDGVMAFFNAPVPQADHLVRAVRAAWTIRESVKRLHQELPPAYRLSFGLGVGCGEAVVGNVGTAQLMNYTAIGDTVNKVKRLQENAEGGQLLISGHTYETLRDSVNARSIGDIFLKGQAQAERVYEVLAVK